MSRRRTQEEFITWLHGKHYDALFLKAVKYASSKSGLQDAVEDSVQETFLIAAKKYKELQGHPDIGGWLYLTCIYILKNIHSVYMNREKHEAYSMDDETKPEVKDPRDRMAEYEAEENFRQLLKRIYSLLSRKQKGIFKAYFVNEQSIDEIAEQNGSTIQAIKGIIYRIRNRLKRKLR